MLPEIKNKIEKELEFLLKDFNKRYSLTRLSPLLYESIKDFVLRDGKRIRPALFVIGYKGFSKKTAPGLYRSAVSIELLHDFLLVHDDIIDKSDTRRGKPSMHAMLNKHLKNHKMAKFNGQDLSIVVGDVMYAMAIDSFLAIREKPKQKERALRNFIRAAAYTGAGEFIELMSGIIPIRKISKNDIYKIYDYKTANYTFSAPLSTGALLAGADESQIRKLSEFGICVGRAFQIKDDILGLFADEKETGKSIMSDLQEAKRTLLIWHAYHHAGKTDKSYIKAVFSKEKINESHLLQMRKLVKKTGSLNFARKTITAFLKKAQNIIVSSQIQPKYKKFLYGYCDTILKT